MNDGPPFRTMASGAVSGHISTRSSAGPSEAPTPVRR
jgi:hypothetical protein